MGAPADLLLAAACARERAYAPYSGFRVGAALRSAGGRIHAAANVENAAFPQSQCAEASAIGAMIAAGDRTVSEVLVIGSDEGPCTPCGGCRQRLAEFAEPGVPVHMLGANGALLTRSLGELLPESFGLGIAAAANRLSAASLVQSRAPGFAPMIGMVLGSGLGAIADAITPVASFPYDELPGLPRPSIEGHAGKLVLGHLGGVPVACLRGRVHLYEGVAARAVQPLIHLLSDLGCRGVILTNAAGSLRADLPPGSIALITDHINLMGTNPLVGPNDPGRGVRFPDMTAVYDGELGNILERHTPGSGAGLGRGVYLAVLGPSFETPAEIRAFRALGADLVGMSTVPEAIIARHAGLKVLGLSIVTNLASGLGGSELSHAETLARSAAAAGTLLQILTHAMRELAHAVTTDS